MIRSLDILISFLFIICLLPLWLLIIPLLLVTGEGRVFYRQSRIGRYGKSFELLKFATMRSDSPGIGTGELTISNDPRVLPFGRILRKAKINETPQFINVLAGQMSMVGPRPQTPFYFSVFPLDIQNQIKKFSPGITGVGSIFFRDEEELTKDMEDPVAFDIDVIVPYKGSLEVWFAENKSLKIYALIIILTAWCVFFPKTKLHARMLKGAPPPPPQLAALIP